MMELYARNWWAVMAEGAALLLFGLIALFYPLAGVVSLVYFFAAFAVIQGVFGIMAGYDFRRAGLGSGWLVAIGVVSVVAGLMAFTWPGATLVTLYAIVSIWAIATGVMRVVSAFRHIDQRSESRLMLVAGAISVAFGLILALKPGLGLLAISLLIGIYAVAAGVAMLTFGAYLRERPAQRVTITRAPVEAKVERDRTRT